ncbi:hypothetical protein ACFYW6_17870 [Streptomyces sp. NPDC002659]|uniref:LexA family protein n=1 Tax=Streptomyces sp. NPDC002659 TaxID=3364656 RepID=UPI00369D30C0
MDHLSARQRILGCIQEWIAETGEGPSIRQIGQRVGLSSSSSVAYQLGRLEQHGLIQRSGRRLRDCRLHTDLFSARTPSHRATGRHRVGSARGLARLTQSMLLAASHSIPQAVSVFAASLGSSA